MPVYIAFSSIIGMLAGAYFTKTISLIFAGIVGVVVYVVTMRKTGGMDSEDIGLILPAKIRKKLKL